MGILQRLIGVVSTLLGLVGLTLPFAYGQTPWEALQPGFGFTQQLAAPGFLPIPIAFWYVRRQWGHISMPEIFFAYLLSSAAMISALYLSISEAIESGLPSFQIASMVGGCWGLAAMILLLYARQRWHGASRVVLAETILVGGYLPNAGFALIAFGLELRWDVGAYVILATCIGYFSTVALASLPSRGDDNELADSH